MKKNLVFGLMILAVFFAGSAQAQFFIGVGVNNNSYDYEDVGNSTGSKIYGGYYFDNGMFVEVEQVKLGKADIDLTPLSLEMGGTVAYVGYGVQPSTGWGFFGKGGLYSFNTELSDGSSSIDDDSSGLALGCGFTYAFSESFALRGELTSYIGVEDFADDGSVTGGSLGIEFRF